MNVWFLGSIECVANLTNSSQLNTVVLKSVIQEVFPCCNFHTIYCRPVCWFYFLAVLSFLLGQEEILRPGGIFHDSKKQIVDIPLISQWQNFCPFWLKHISFERPYSEVSRMPKIINNDAVYKNHHGTSQSGKLWGEVSWRGHFLSSSSTSSSSSSLLPPPVNPYKIASLWPWQLCHFLYVVVLVKQKVFLPHGWYLLAPLRSKSVEVSS